MKKFGYIGLILGLVILFSSNTQAQYYYTSYGYAQDWYLPKYVQYSIYDNYYGYEIAHVERYKKHGHTNFNVLLHRNGWFVELRYDDHGHIYKTINHKWHYPLMSHRCSMYCGYHHSYYQVYYPKYHHKSKGHKHHTKVYVDTYHGKKHDKGHKNEYNYYVNVHIEKQQKHNDQSSQHQYQADQNKQRESSRGAILIPEATHNNKGNARTSDRSTNSVRVQRTSSGERYTRPTTSTVSSARTTAYKGESLKSRQR